MKLRPFRFAQAGKHVLRERIVADAAKSPAGQRSCANAKRCSTCLLIVIQFHVSTYWKGLLWN